MSTFHNISCKVRLGLYSSETAELSLRDYGGQLCLLTHCSIPSGVTGKQRPAVPLVVTCLKSRGPVAPPVGATQRAFSSSGAGGPRSHIRQGAPQCVSKGCCCSDAAWFALRWEGLFSRAGPAARASDHLLRLKEAVQRPGRLARRTNA